MRIFGRRPCGFLFAEGLRPKRADHCYGRSRIVSRDFDALVEQALTVLEHGETENVLLQRYPAEAHALAPLLTTAAYCRQSLAFAEPPSQEALAAGRRRFLEEAARQKESPALRLSLPAWLRPSLRPAFALAMALVVLVVLAGGGATLAAAHSLPGDYLYPVKLVSEQVRLAFTSDPAVRTELVNQFAEERRQEAQTIVALRRQANVRFQGSLESFNAENWTVDGFTVGLDEETQVDGDPTLDATIAVLAWSPGDGTLCARHLRVIPPLTPIGATPTSSPTHWPTHTPRPTSTPTSSPTRTQPSPTASPTGKGHQPTHGPMTPTKRLESMTPEPSGTHGPHRTPGPAETRRPQPTQTPLATGTPTPAPQPTESATRPPEPTATPTQPPAPTRSPHGPMMTPGPHHTPQH
jgi:hypothetical protein